MKKRVMILGASRYYIRCILAARELGCEVIVIDRNSSSTGFRYADYYEVVDISDIQGAIEVAKRYGVDGVIAVNDFGVMTAAAIAMELGLAGISTRSAEYATKKAWMRKKWEEAGISSVKFRIVNCLEEAYRAAEELDVWPLILKPVDSRGGGSRGVSRVDHRDQLEKGVEFAQSFYDDKSIMIEEFLEGIEHSVETITYEGKTYVLAVSDKVKTPPPYRVDKSVTYPTEVTGTGLERIRKVAEDAVRALEIEIGAAHVEMCTTRDGPKLFELGARCGGGGTPDPIVPFLTGIEMFKEVIRIAIGEKPQSLTPFFEKGCVYRFLTPNPGKVKKIAGVEKVRTWKNILDCEVFVHEGEEIRPVRIGGDRTGFVIAGGENRREAIALADQAEKTILFEYF
jgi:biotin carboxylase